MVLYHFNLHFFNYWRTKNSVERSGKMAVPLRKACLGATGRLHTHCLTWRITFQDGKCCLLMSPSGGTGLPMDSNRGHKRLYKNEPLEVNWILSI